MAWPPLGIQTNLQEINNEVDCLFFVRMNNEVDFVGVDSIKIDIEMVYAIGKH